METITKFVSSYFSQSSVDSDDAQLNKFVNDPHCTIVVAVLLNGQIKFTNETPSKPGNPCIGFFKTQPKPLSSSNFYQIVCISSLTDTALSSFYGALHQFYLPTFCGSQKTIEPKLRGLLSELDAGLGRSALSESFSSESIGNVLSVSDELKYWRYVQGSGKGSQKERAECFVEILMEIEPSFSTNMEGQTVDDALETIEVTQDALSDLWKAAEANPPYPEERMRNLMDCIASSIISFSQKTLSALDIWKGSINSFNEDLTLTIELVSRWLGICESLTTTFWKHYALHPWRGDAYKPPLLLSYKDRLEGIIRVRSVYDLVYSLISPGEQESMREMDVFKMFTEFDAIQYNPFTDSLWAAAVANFDRKMQGVEKSVAEKFKVKFRNLDDNSSQLLREFQKYRLLFERPVISQYLSAEREHLFGQLQVQLKQINSDYQQRYRTLGTEKHASKAINVPEVVDNIIWLRQLEGKISDMLRLCGSLMADLSGFDTFKKSCESFLAKLRESNQAVFDDWCSEISGLLDDPRSNVSLETNGKLMELNHGNGKLYVNYGDRLVTLLKEVRQLSSFGYRIPKSILKIADSGQKLFRQGIVLKQVAQFYNTIDQQMIPSQKLIMLNSALEFEKIIKNPRVPSSKSGDSGLLITWDNPDALETYIKNASNRCGETDFRKSTSPTLPFQALRAHSQAIGNRFAKKPAEMERNPG